MLLYDLTSTYFECDPPSGGKRKYGHSRDKRTDCVQVVIALVVTTEGFPLAYEVMPGNTSDKTTLKEFIDKIEKQYGKANRLWIMDRGIPTEEVLSQMRESKTAISYLVGTPRGKLTKLEKSFLSKSWQAVRNDVEVKLLSTQDEVYVLTRSQGRKNKERAMRQRKLKKLLYRLRELRSMKLSRDDLLIKLGSAKKEVGIAFRLIDIQLPDRDQPVTPPDFFLQIESRQTQNRLSSRGHVFAAI